MGEPAMRARHDQPSEYIAPKGGRKHELRLIKSGGSKKDFNPTASTDDREFFVELDKKAQSEWAKPEALRSGNEAKARDLAKYNKIIDAVLQEHPELDPKEAARIAKREADIAKSMAEIRANQAENDARRRKEIEEKFGIK